MIGVISRSDERVVIEELFQLFKTPWEYYQPGRSYEVLLVTTDSVPKNDATAVIIYGTERKASDDDGRNRSADIKEGVALQWGEGGIPIYGNTRRFHVSESDALVWDDEGNSIGYWYSNGRQKIFRLGYDLFQEIEFLLTTGQPAGNALSATLDLHIDLLRRLIATSSSSLVEIPPVPAGYDFAACLTHDIDFIGIRNHFLDHSMWGFLYRATAVSLLDWIRGKMSWRCLHENLQSALALPFVYVGACRDPWDQFERCIEIEDGSRSTFFFIPFKNRAGRGFDKGKSARRAAKYDVRDVGGTIQYLREKGCEIGVHGIDAWHSVESGKEELLRILDIAEQPQAGIRLHWLCFDGHTYKILDQAGYSYDSTVGYNEAVGFKAGTSAPFRPLNTNSLIEIPLHIQDTALYGRTRLNASEEMADDICGRIIDHVKTHGGVLTVLWHQRSLGPERLWGDHYQRLVHQIRQEKSWFATAGEIAAWYLKRRAARYERNDAGQVQIRISNDGADIPSLPKLILRRYKPKRLNGGKDWVVQVLEYDDTALPESQSSLLD